MFDNEPSNQMPPMPQAPQSATPPQDFHTMPERFMDAGSPGGTSAAPSGSGGGMGKKIMIIAISAIVVGGLGAGAWYYFTKMAPSKNTTNQAVNTNKNKNTNTAVNSNTNSNTNDANLNGNLNANVNTNVNVNTNSNLNTNVNSNTNSTTNANTNSTLTTGSPLPSSTDTDSDGLTDVEEQVYGTQANNPDTDSDGFIDGMRTLANGKSEGEVYNGYCPTKPGSVKLDETACGVLRNYTNTTFNYALWIPKNWLVQPTSGDDKTVIITPDIATSEFFQVSVLDNPSQLTAKNYYLSLNPGVDAAKLKDVTTNGLDGIMSLDQNTAYFVKGTKIYIVTYNTDGLTKVNFRTTYLVMYRSFRLVAATVTNTNSTLNTNQ